MSRGLMVLTALVGLEGCWLQDAEDRSDCDRALAVVCSCATVDCTAAVPLPIVATLRRCDPDEIYRSLGYHLAVCITDSPTYCAVVDSLQRADGSLCDQTCHEETACDREATCHDYQFNACGAP